MHASHDVDVHTQLLEPPETLGITLYTATLLAQLLTQLLTETPVAGSNWVVIARTQ